MSGKDAGTPRVYLARHGVASSLYNFQMFTTVASPITDSPIAQAKPNGP